MEKIIIKASAQPVLAVIAKVVPATKIKISAEDKIKLAISATEAI